jgi:diacylglycerol kinase (ATP)
MGFLAEEARRVRMRAVWSWQGFVHVWRTERSLMQWVVANVISAVAVFVVPLSAGQRGTILMGGIMVLAMECLNTAIERVVDDISTQRRARAGQAKDAGSAAVAVTAIAVGVAWVCAICGLVW